MGGVLSGDSVVIHDGEMIEEYRNGIYLYSYMLYFWFHGAIAMDLCTSVCCSTIY